MILRTSCEGHATATPDWTASGTGTSTASALLTPWALTATSHVGTGLLLFGALTAAGHVGHDCLVYQGLVEFATEGQFGNFDRLSVIYIKLHVSFPLPASLDSRTHNNVTASSARNGTLDQQQIAFSVDAHYFQGLNGHALGAHVTGHFLALEYTTRSLALADRARDAVGNGVTVGVVLTAEVPALDGTGKAFTFGLTGNVYQLARSEEFSIDQVASLVLAVFETEFPDTATSGNVRFGEVTSLSGSHARSTTLTNSDLHCTVAIGFFSFELGDTIRFDLDDRDRNGDTFFGENAGHTALTTDYTNSHVVNLMSVRGFHPLWPPISERYTTKTRVLAEADLHFHTCRKIELHKSVNGFIRWLDDVQDALVSTDLVLVTRVFVDVRGDQNGEPLFASRQWNWTTHLSTSTFRGFHDFLGRLVDQAMVEGLQPDTDLLILHWISDSRLLFPPGALRPLKGGVIL